VQILRHEVQIPRHVLQTQQGVDLDVVTMVQIPRQTRADLGDILLQIRQLRKRQRNGYSALTCEATLRCRFSAATSCRFAKSEPASGSQSRDSCPGRDDRPGSTTHNITGIMLSQP
jgi:hypothetical protein